jgi:hypothetical protein
VPEHAKLVLQRDDATGGRRLELGEERGYAGESAEQKAERPD